MSAFLDSDKIDKFCEGRRFPDEKSLLKYYQELEFICFGLVASNHSSIKEFLATGSASQNLEVFVYCAQKMWKLPISYLLKQICSLRYLRKQ